MNIIRIVFVVITVCLSFCYNDQNSDQQSFCDKNLPDSKISDFEKCEKLLPPEIMDISNQCLKECNVGTTYRDFRNTFCDFNNLKKKYIKCHRAKRQEQSKTGTKTEMSEEKIEKMRKHEVCMREAMGEKIEQESN